MRSVFALFFLILYSVSNFGLSLRLDWCGSNISGIGLYSEESGVSECCVKYSSEEDCCNSQQVFLQDDSDKAQRGEFHNAPIVMGYLAGLPSHYSLQVPLKQPFSFCCDAHAPPIAKHSLQVLNSCFLI